MHWPNFNLGAIPYLTLDPEVQTTGRFDRKLVISLSFKHPLQVAAGLAYIVLIP